MSEGYVDELLVSYWYSLGEVESCLVQVVLDELVIECKWHAMGRNRPELEWIALFRLNGCLVD